jgi:hypothetical protein
MVPPTETPPPIAVQTRGSILPGLNTSQEILAAWYVPVASAGILLNACTYLQDSAGAFQAGEIGIEEMRNRVKNMRDVLGLIMTIVDGWIPKQEKEEVK